VTALWSYVTAMNLLRYAPLVALLATGCASPAQPTAPAATVDSRLVAAVAALDSLPTPLPFNGLTIRQWRERLNVPIQSQPLDQDYGAVWNGTAIVVNTHLTGYDTLGVAGLIAHELRHADGMRHDCGPHQDHRATPWSAYAVHIWTLEQLGAHEQARQNDGGYCD
jgi:hypothetical protein